MSHVKLITETRVYLCHQKSQIYGFFHSFSKVLEENFIKTIRQEMKNGLSLRQQQLQVIMYYIITSAFHKLMHLQTKEMHPEKTKNTFIFL